MQQLESTIDPREAAWQPFITMCHRLVGDPVVLPASGDITRDSLTKIYHWDDIGVGEIPRLAILTDGWRRFIDIDGDADILTAWNNGAPSVRQIDEKHCEAALQAVRDVIAGKTHELVEIERPAPAKAEPRPEKPEQKRLTSFNAHDLMGMEFAPVRYVVPGYIAEGCTILAGASKLGKSWLVLQAALAVARGGTCLGGQCDQGDVLYLALEDNPRRLKDRLQKQNPYIGLVGQTMPACLQFETEWPRADQGGLQKIIEWLTAHQNAKLVIIDVLKMFRANRKGNKNPYDLDYEDIGPLSKIAAAFNVAIVVVHHTNKGALSSDPFDRVNGTGGISGAADTTLIMARNDEGLVELYGRGREIEEIETAVSFDKATCTWCVRGNAHEVHMSDTASAIVRVLDEAEEPMGPTDIAVAAGQKPVVVRQHLPRLAKDGKIEKEGRGKWVIAGKVIGPKPPVTSVTNVTFDPPANDNAPTKVTKVTKVMGGECGHNFEGGDEGDAFDVDRDVPAFLKGAA